MCGEHWFSIVWMGAVKGSSPRVRGTLRHLGCNPCRLGIIPACAGNTVVLVDYRGDFRDHPRVCGEHVAVVRVDFACLGSSPRVRGTRHAAGGSSEAAGIIPACAGNTNPISRVTERDRDHPRVCGEHRQHTAGRQPTPGSSPRVRGTLSERMTALPRCGIIPACAGNTKQKNTAIRASWDHPRVCGEHPFRAGVHAAVRGSSPRVRGTPRGRAAGRPRGGIIPACAGNTSTAVSWILWIWDHPRVCGEHYVPVIAAYNLTGSSPRVRGTQLGDECQKKHAGIIPACAGNTPMRLTMFHTQSGSSPRVRGTPGRSRPRTPAAGIIPACAGNTWPD